MANREDDEFYYDTGDEDSAEDDTRDEDDCSSVEEVSASSAEDEGVKDDSSEEEDDDAAPVRDILFPRRSRALKMLPEDFRILLEKEQMMSISEGDAKKCLGKKRFKIVEETHPIPGSFFIVDSKGFLILRWLTQGPGVELLLDDQTSLRLKMVAGPVRNQWMHLICWAYVCCDLISAGRVLNGLDKEFVPLSPMFLCRNVCPQQYRERCEAGKKHCCFGMDMMPGLTYAKLYGVCKERPEEVMFDCAISESLNGGEQLYKVKEIYHYDTMESALQKLKSGYPIGAGLLLFDDWDKYYSDETYEGMNIYEGPEPGKAYIDEHAVVLIDFRIIRGIKVAICKLSNGLHVANGGYIAVSLEVMVSMAGASKKYRSVECDNKPQYLLRDFYSVEVEMGPERLATVAPKEAESHEKFKVDIGKLPHDLLAPTYRSPAASTFPVINAASKACKEYCEQLGVDACMKLFEQFKSYEGLYFFLCSYLSMSEDPEIHFKYIEAAKTGQIKEVERVTRESNFYDAEKAKKTCLMEAKFPDARPLINVCDRFGFVPDLTHDLYTNNMLRYIEGYVQKVNPGNASLVVGHLLDDKCPEDFIKSLILSVRSLLPVEPLVEECEKRNRLRLLAQFLERSEDVHVHNALGKIVIDSNKNPEHCLTTNPY